MREALDLLATALSDVGYWQWWAAELPERFQLEFGGAQLWFAPLAEGKPPCGQVALRFLGPSLVAFLSWPETGLPHDWPAQLHADQLQPLALAHDGFCLDDPAALQALVDDGPTLQTLHGGVAQAGQARHCLSFRAGRVGCVVAAEEMEIVGHGGVLPLTELADRSARWWDYWREYWRVRETPAALPKDYACEVTIPLKA